ncbi:type I toxin-antitoxin system ptaRNA1 family toxin [Halomonas sp. AOP12-C2-37]
MFTVVNWQAETDRAIPEDFQESLTSIRQATAS